MGRPPRIDRQLILARALELADESGLSSVTMAALAARLGVTPMALYRHVESRDDLLDGLVERLLGEMSGLVALSEDDDVEAALLRFVAAADLTAAKHPDVFMLLLVRPARTVSSQLARDQVYAMLGRSGVPAHLLRHAERLTTTTILGIAAGHASMRFPGSDDHSQELTARFVRSGLEALIEKERG